MGEERRRQLLTVAAIMHGVLATAWFVLGVVVPSAGALRDALLLVPSFAAAGALILGDARFPQEAMRAVAWSASFLDIIGLPTLGLYLARLILARTTPTTPAACDLRWTTSDGLSVTIAALVLIGLTILAHLFTIVVGLRYVYAGRKHQRGSADAQAQALAKETTDALAANTDARALSAWPKIAKPVAFLS